MSKFKIGDVVIANDLGNREYAITCENTLSIVESITASSMVVRVLEKDALGKPELTFANRKYTVMQAYFDLYQTSTQQYLTNKQRKLLRFKSRVESRHTGVQNAV